MLKILSLNTEAPEDLEDILDASAGWPHGDQPSVGWKTSRADCQFAGSQFWGWLPEWLYGSMTTPTGNPGMVAATTAAGIASVKSRGLAEICYLPGTTPDEKLAYAIDVLLPPTIDYQMANASGGAIDASYTGIIPLDWEPNYHAIRSDYYTGITTFLSLYIEAFPTASVADAYRAFKSWDKAITKANFACIKAKMPLCKIVGYADVEQGVYDLDSDGPVGSLVDADYSAYCTALAGTPVSKTRYEALIEQNTDNETIWTDRNLDALALFGYMQTLRPVSDAAVLKTNAVLHVPAGLVGTPAWGAVGTGGTGGATGEFVLWDNTNKLLYLTNCVGTFVPETVTFAGGGSGVVDNSPAISQPLLDYPLTEMSKGFRRMALEVKRCADMSVDRGQLPKRICLWLNTVGVAPAIDGISLRACPGAWCTMWMAIAVEIGVDVVLVWESIPESYFPYRGMTWPVFVANVKAGLANLNRAVNAAVAPIRKRAEALGHGGL